jgi:hypothetical protein
MKNTEDIEREIRKIQLQREQLSLKRELANEKLKQWILDRPTAAGQLIIGGLLRLKALVLCQWKPIVGILLVVSAAASVNAWLEHSAREDDRIASELYYKELNSHVEKTCGKFCSFGDTGDYISFNNGPCENTPGRTHSWCRLEAESNFRLARVQN